MSATARDRFEGQAERECGEHRTLGVRAWCHDCTEYCYPDGPCRGCELPELRRRLTALEEVAAAARTYAALEVADDPTIIGPDSSLHELAVALTAAERQRALPPPSRPERSNPYSRAILQLQEDVDTLATERDELRRELARHLGSDQCALAIPILLRDP